MIAAFALLLMPAPAQAADNQVRIINASKVDPDPVKITVGDTITWTNDDRLPHDIYLEGGRKLNSTPILPGDSFTTDPILTSGTLRYGIDSASNLRFTISSTPKPTTTTAPTTTTTTTAPTTTTASTTTTSPASSAPSASTSSTSTASSSTTSSTIAAAAPPPSGGGGSSAAPLLAAAAAVVAALAGVTFWAWRRSGEIPYGPSTGTSSPPPTAGQSPV